MTSVPAPRKVKLRDVALACHVSVATASKALGGHLDVASETRKRVTDVARTLGYRSSSAGPGATTATILFLTDDLRSSYATDILRGVLTESLARQLHTLVQYDEHAFQPASRHEWLRALATPNLRGVVVLAVVTRQIHALLAKLAIPVVVIDPSTRPGSPLLWIDTDNHAGAFAATKHLAELGHREIVYLGPATPSLVFTARRAGHLDALQQHGLDHRAELVIDTGSTFDSAVRAATGVLDAHDRPRAVIAATDVIAGAVYRAAQLAGLRIPEDLSVVGFDDTVEASRLSPPLTTIHQPLAEMGAAAVRMLDEPGPRAAHTRVESHLIVRASATPREATPEELTHVHNDRGEQS